MELRKKNSLSCPKNYFILKRNHNFLSQGQKLDLKCVDPPQTVSSLCIRMQVLNKKIKRLFSKTFYFVSTAEFESNKVKLKKKRLPKHKSSFKEINISVLLENLKFQEFYSSVLLLPVAGTLSCWISEKSFFEIFLVLNLWDFKPGI